MLCTLGGQWPLLQLPSRVQCLQIQVERSIGSPPILEATLTWCKHFQFAKGIMSQTQPCGGWSHVGVLLRPLNQSSWFQPPLCGQLRGWKRRLSMHVAWDGVSLGREKWLYHIYLSLVGYSPLCRTAHLQEPIWSECRQGAGRCQ